MARPRAWLGGLVLAVILLTGCSAPGDGRGPAAPGALPRTAAPVQAESGAGGNVAQPPSAPEAGADTTPRASAESAPPVGPDSAAGSAAALTQPLPLHPFQPAAGRARVVALDPGHGGPEVGAAGAGVAEKDVNLRIAVKLKDLLEREGLQVVLTRDGDSRAASPAPGGGPAGFSATRIDLQARIDLANAAGADVYLSIHNNGSTSPAEGGTEVWWDGRRPFAAFNRALATEMLGALLQAIRATGYPAASRGLKEDSNFRVFQGRAFPIFVLGPPRTGASTSRATLMPAVLGETLFLTNPAEAALLARDDVRAAIARGYRDGLLRYFRLIDEGALALPPGGLLPETPNYYDIVAPPPQGGGQPQR